VNKESPTSQQTNVEPIVSKKASKKRGKNTSGDQTSPLTQQNHKEPSSKNKSPAKKRVKKDIIDQATSPTQTLQQDTETSLTKSRLKKSSIDQATPPSLQENNAHSSNKKVSKKKDVKESVIDQVTPPSPQKNYEPPSNTNIVQAMSSSPFENKPSSNKKSSIKKDIKESIIDQATPPSPQKNNERPSDKKSPVEKRIEESSSVRATLPLPQDIKEPPLPKKSQTKKSVRESRVSSSSQEKMDINDLNRKKSSLLSRKNDIKPMLPPEVLIERQLQDEANIEEIWSTYLQLEATSKITLLKRENFIAIINQILKNYNSDLAPQRISKVLEDMKLCKYSIWQDEKNIVIEIYLCNGNLKDARTLFDEIHKAKVETQSDNPFTKAANLMIEAYGKEKDLNQVEEILKIMKSKEILADVNTDKALRKVVLNNMGNGSSSWFDQLVIRQLVNSVLAREICVEFAKIGKFNEALELYVNMKAVNMQLELDDFLKIINEMKKANHEKEALDMIDELVSSKLILNQEALGIISDLYLETISLEKAYDFLIGLIKRGYNLDIRFFNKLIQQYARLGKVNSTLSLVTRMKSVGILPDFDTYTSLLELFIK
ncbi:168_t:CDS:1, partial [Ambispora leptoticha]